MQKEHLEKEGLIHHWHNPGPSEIGQSPFEFLDKMPRATHIHISGKDSSRCRAMVTLLHGNEPSGLFALYHLLKKAIQPAIDIHCYVMSVGAAKQEPGFFYRTLPGQKDLNRCFGAPFGTSLQGQLAQKLLRDLYSLKPEALIDVHNTSGTGPAFGVHTFMDKKHDALISLFTHRVIVSHVKLKALMEISDSKLPVVTIECGGAQDPGSNLMAIDGLLKYMTRADVFSLDETNMPLEYFHNPVRLELTQQASIGYAETALPDCGVTLLPDLDDCNFGIVDRESVLGFLNGELEELLSVRNTEGEECVSSYFRCEDGELKPRCKLKLFMITANPQIAKSDCLFYLVAV